MASLHPAKALHGLLPDRWRQLVGDAEWVLDHFAEQAFRDGWSIGDLFGLWWWDDAGAPSLKDAWGGVADRLQGSRSLMLTADSARWRWMFTGEPDMFARGTYPNLKPMWES
ncbi:MAG: hypothetical protein ABIT09_07800 [Croceibacterium sp.]